MTTDCAKKRAITFAFNQHDGLGKKALIHDWHYPCTFNHGYAASWRTMAAKAS
jgi:hypothetical protein